MPQQAYIIHIAAVAIILATAATTTMILKKKTQEPTPAVNIHLPHHFCPVSGCVTAYPYVRVRSSTNSREVG